MKLGILRFAAVVGIISIGSSPAMEGNGELMPGPTEHSAPVEFMGMLAWGETSMRRIVETQTTFVRRRATEAEQRAAVQKGKAIFDGMSPKKKAEFQKKKIRYIAVKLPPKVQATTTPPAKKAAATSTPTPAPDKKVAEADDFMIYDTLGGSTVNKYVYTPNDSPRLGAVMKMDEYEALYVGL